ncbi:MAG: hypothetical protein ACYTFK_01795 [Planctomycetota bacterium]|jgi:hypothetical protein
MIILAVCIFFGILFAVIGPRKGFFKTWVLLFNILISIYIGVMLSPTLVAFRPEIEHDRYYLASFIAMASLVNFTILQLIVSGFFRDLRECFCPKMFDTLGAAIGGFVGGFCITSFVFVIICVMPFSKMPVLKGVCGDGSSTSIGAEGAVRACDFVSTVSLQPQIDTHRRVRNVVDWLVQTDCALLYDLGNKKKTSPGVL